MIQAESSFPSQKVTLRFLLTLALFFVLNGRALAQSPEKLKTESELMMESMQSISKQLGVTCTTCHNVKNWKDNSKKEFKISLDHMKITQSLIDQGFDGIKQTKASCFMCHQGELKPAHLKKGDLKVFN